MKKVAFLTTVNHNVGDDFIREGIVYLLKTHVGKFEQILIHKHEPARPGPGPLKLKGFRKIWSVVRKGWVEKYFDRFFEADIVVQAGAPVYWLDNHHNSSMAEWVEPFWYERIARICKTKPVLNLAAGSCLAYNENAQKVLDHPTLRKFIEDIHHFCSVTTVRDILARDILDGLKLKNYLIPCASLFARRNMSVVSKKEEFFIINYMELGGHYSFKSQTKKNAWARKILDVYAIAKKNFPVKWVCHNLKEVREAKNLGIHSKEIFYSKSYHDYIDFYSRGIGGVLNRVHGAMMLASFGRKAYVVGTDSRLQMADLIGIPTAHVDAASVLASKEIVNSVLSGRQAFSEKMERSIAEAKLAYGAAIREGLRGLCL